MGRSAPSLFH